MSEQRDVDCYIDCWEGSYRALLAPGVLGERYAMHCHPFARRVLTINNVDDRCEVLRLADAAIARGECDEYVLVADRLPEALERCGLSLEDIEPVLHFVDFHLVTVTTARAPYVLHVAGDVGLTRPFDWVSQAVSWLSADSRFLVANPNFAAHPGVAWKEAMRYEAPYWIGPGFSDQCFLASARRLAAPIYSEWNFVSNRYPMTHIGRIFEARVDAYMRNHGLLRLTDSRVRYQHYAAHGEGSTHFRGSARARVTHFPARFTASVRWRMGGRRLILR